MSRPDHTPTPSGSRSGSRVGPGTGPGQPRDEWVPGPPSLRGDPLNELPTHCVPPVGPTPVRTPPRRGFANSATRPLATHLPLGCAR